MSEEELSDPPFPMYEIRTGWPGGNKSNHTSDNLTTSFWDLAIFPILILLALAFINAILKGATEMP